MKSAVGFPTNEKIKFSALKKDVTKDSFQNTEYLKSNETSPSKILNANSFNNLQEVVENPRMYLKRIKLPEAKLSVDKTEFLDSEYINNISLPEAKVGRQNLNNASNSSTKTRIDLN